jgi:hypothetical protein
MSPFSFCLLFCSLFLHCSSFFCLVDSGYSHRSVEGFVLSFVFVWSICILLLLSFLASKASSVQVRAKVVCFAFHFSLVLFLLLFLSVWGHLADARDRFLCGLFTHLASAILSSSYSISRLCFYHSILVFLSDSGLTCFWRFDWRTCVKTISLTAHSSPAYPTLLIGACFFAFPIECVL